MTLSAILLAQADTMPGGAAGWTSAGLLGSVLGWLLLRHLPEKDRQLKEVMDRHLATEESTRQAHAKTEHEQRQEFTAGIESQRKEFKIMLDAMIDHNEKQVSGLGNALKADLGAIQKAIETMTMRHRRYDPPEETATRVA